MTRIAVVSGGSSGIGREIAAALVRKGLRVYELSRRDVPSPDVTHVPCDLTDESAVNEAVRRIIEESGRIDILVNNAGFGISGSAENTPDEMSVRQMDVNLHGAARLTRACLPQMRKQGRGRILFISSIAGVLPIPFQAWYSASKAAILSYSQALASEIRPFGITVCTILPGDVSTGFTDARKKAEESPDSYDGRVERSVSVMEKDERGGMSPRVVGETVARYALKKNSRSPISVGFSYKCVYALAKILPTRLARWIVGKIYAK